MNTETTATLTEWLARQVVKFCDDTKLRCPHWEDPKVIEDLETLDAKDKGNRVQEYWKKCHTPEAIFRPNPFPGEAQFVIKCRPNDWNGREECKYSNPEAAEAFFKEYIESQEEHVSTDKH